jgi:hypothetical protein
MTRLKCMSGDEVNEPPADPFGAAGETEESPFSPIRSDDRKEARRWRREAEARRLAQEEKDGRTAAEEQDKPEPEEHGDAQG